MILQSLQCPILGLFKGQTRGWGTGEEVGQTLRTNRERRAARKGVTGGPWGWRCQGPTQPRQGLGMTRGMPLLLVPESGQPRG